MSNVIIQNTQTSILDLTPARDVYDVIVVLAPSDTPGDSREITEEMANDDIVQRVMSSGWVTLMPAKTLETILTADTETLDVLAGISATIEPVAVVEPVADVVAEPVAKPVAVAEPVVEPVAEPVAEIVEAPAIVVEPAPLPDAEADSEKPVASHGNKASRHSRK